MILTRGEQNTGRICESRFLIVAVNRKGWIVDWTHGIFRDNQNFHVQGSCQLACFVRALRYDSIKGLFI